MALCLLLSCVVSRAQSNSPVSFSKVANLPYPLVYHAYTHDDESIYAINGLISGNVYSTGLLKYNPAANGQWTVLTNKLTPKIRAVAAYVPATHKIYIMGGQLRNKLGLFNGIEAVDVITGEVESLNVVNPMPATDGGIAVWNNKIYLFGGNESQDGGSAATGKFYEFDPVLKKFNQLPNMPQNLITSGAAVNGAIYVFGGYDQNNNVMRDIYTYNISTNTWKEAGKLPQRVIATATAAWQGKVFLTGSFPDQKFFGYYDTVNQTFTKLKADLNGRRYAGAGIIGSKLYIYGGTLSQTFKGLTSVQVTDVSGL